MSEPARGGSVASSHLTRSEPHMVLRILIRRKKTKKTNHLKIDRRTRGTEDAAPQSLCCILISVLPTVQKCIYTVNWCVLRCPQGASMMVSKRPCKPANLWRRRLLSCYQRRSWETFSIWLGDIAALICRELVSVDGISIFTGLIIRFQAPTNVMWPMTLMLTSQAALQLLER